MQPQTGTGAVESCPACHAYLIYRKDQFRHYSLAEAVIIPEISAAALFWRCPHCGHAWHRWPEGDRLHTDADPLIHAEQPAGYLQHRTDWVDTITCPTCRRTSANADDVRERYCGNCHHHIDDPVLIAVHSTMRARAARQYIDKILDAKNSTLDGPTTTRRRSP